MASEITVQFNRKAFTFSRQTLEKKVRLAAKTQAPTDASSLLHRIMVPGVKHPVSVQWFASYILETPPVGLSKNGLPKGAYGPQQVLSVAEKLAPLGVKLESVSPSAKYARWSKAGAEALQKQIEDIRKALGQTNGNSGRKTARKATAHKPAKKETQQAQESETVTE